MNTGHSQITLGNDVWHQPSSKNDLPQRQWQQTLISLSHSLIGIRTMSGLRQPGVKSWHISFHSIFSPLFRTYPWVWKQWSSEMTESGKGGVQQASIRGWRRGVFTELPSLHLASPQPRLDRQLQFSAYWVWQHTYWPSAAIVSPASRKHKQTYMHRDSCSSLFFCCIRHPSPFYQVKTVPLWVRLTTERLSAAHSLVFTVLSLCQSPPNASDACRACPLCAYACAARA